MPEAHERNIHHLKEVRMLFTWTCAEI